MTARQYLQTVYDKLDKAELYLFRQGLEAEDAYVAVYDARDMLKMLVDRIDKRKSKRKEAA